MNVTENTLRTYRDTVGRLIDQGTARTSGTDKPNPDIRHIQGSSHAEVHSP